MGKRGSMAVLFAVVCMLLGSCSSVSLEPSGKGFVDNGPSTVYGKLVDQSNRPISGEAIVAEWAIDGKIYSAQTITLSKEEAKALDNAMKI